MQVRLNALSIVLALLSFGCAPEEKCNGVLFYDPVEYACRPCPKDSTFKNGTCQCKAQYEFANNRCVLMDGAVIEVPDTGTSSTYSCMDYCDFAKSCIGDNTLAKGALADIILGLHADNAVTCTSSCQSDLGGDGMGDPVVACIEAGRAGAACAGQSTQPALGAALTLVGDCCRPHQTNALCKSICKVVKANALVSSSVDYCAE